MDPVSKIMEESQGKDNMGFVSESKSEFFKVLPPRKKSSFLSIIDYSDINSNTYVYDADKSLQNMTVRLALINNEFIRSKNESCVYQFFSAILHNICF